MATSVFATHRHRVYAHRWQVTIEVGHLCGGTPLESGKLEGWLRSKLGETSEDHIQTVITEYMLEHEVALDVAFKEVVKSSHLNGFRRFTPELAAKIPGAVPYGFYAEGRCLKSCVKENSNIQWADKRWGPTKKGTKNFFAEHLFVEEEEIPIRNAVTGVENVTEPSHIDERFVHVYRGNGISTTEVVDDAVLSFTLLSDYDFKYEDLATLFVSSELNGFGSGRSQGYGRFVVTQFDDLGKGKGRIVPVIEIDPEEARLTAEALADEAGVSTTPID